MNTYNYKYIGLPYDEKKYKKVIRLCELEADIEILQGGDMTEIGEKVYLILYFYLIYMVYNYK